MAAALRASGPDFDVDAFVADCDWRVAKVFRRGEVRLSNTRPGGRVREESGLNVVVSEAGFDGFAQQVRDAIAFLSDGAAEVRRLVSFPGVTGVVLDFGIAWRDGATHSDQFPGELVRLAGTCGIALELSHYPVHANEGEHRSPDVR